MPCLSVSAGGKWGQGLGAAGAKMTALSLEKWGHGAPNETTVSQALLRFGLSLSQLGNILMTLFGDEAESPLSLLSKSG